MSFIEAHGIAKMKLNLQTIIDQTSTMLHGYTAVSRFAVHDYDRLYSVSTTSSDRKMTRT